MSSQLPRAYRRMSQVSFNRHNRSGIMRDTDFQKMKSQREKIKKQTRIIKDLNRTIKDLNRTIKDINRTIKDQRYEIYHLRDDIYSPLRKNGYGV